MNREYDIVIKGGTVLDGSGSEGVRLDIGVKGDKIVCLGDLDVAGNVKCIDAVNKIVSPGFIDIHSHSDFLWLLHPECSSKVYDGVTTEICGNCGSSPFPVMGELLEHRKKGFEKFGLEIDWKTANEYFAMAKSRSSSINRGFLVGHGNLRACYVGYEDRLVDKDELSSMSHELTSALNEGVFGMSTGIAYPPGCYASHEEIVQLCKILKEHNAIYTTHIRDEGDFVEQSITEAINVARETGVDLQISHIKTAGKTNWHKLDGIESILKRARAEGVKISCDRYPYIASSTDLDAIFPKWVYEGGIAKEIERLKNKSDRERIKDELVKKGNDCEEFWKSVVVSSVLYPANRSLEGKSIWEIANMRRKPAFETVCDLLIEEDARVDVLFFNMSESNLREFLQWDFVMVGSDSSIRSTTGILNEGKPHPRSYGTFSRILSKYCGDGGIFTLQNAINKMTGMPAIKFGVKKRGFIREGCFADIVIFDKDIVKDMSQFHDPHQYSRGINYVIVNGKVTLENGQHTGSFSGKVLRRG